MSDFPLTVVLEKIVAELSRPPDPNEAPWRSEPITEKQIALINQLQSEIGIDPKAVPPLDCLTRGQASDMIGCFLRPDGHQIELLRFFRVRGAKDMNQTDARRALAPILNNPKKGTYIHNYLPFVGWF